MATTTLQKTLWSIQSASQGGSWTLDATGNGLRKGILYIPTALYATRQPSTITLVGSRGTRKTVETLDGAAFGNLTVKFDGVIGTLSVFVLTSTGDRQTEGLFQIDALFTRTNSDGGAVDAYSKTESDDRFVGKRAVEAVQKATAGSSTQVAELASTATLAQVIAWANNCRATLNTVRSTAGSAYSAVNGVIDSLTNASIMKS